MNEIETMLAKANQARANAYAPYSHFTVGCCIKTSQNNYFTGCNVENASYSLTTCAEASAITHMVTAGEQKISALLVVAGGDILCTPCGACRQRIREFALPDTPVYLCNPLSYQSTMTLIELLPASFGPEHLEKKS